MVGAEETVVGERVQGYLVVPLNVVEKVDQV